MMASLTMDYSPMAYEHPHDIVFQQLLQTARLPSAALFRQDPNSRPAKEAPHRLQRRRTTSSVATRSSSSYDSEADEGYHADKDNGRRKLLKVSCDFFLEITPMSSRKTRCHACRTEIPQSTYRLRSIDTSESFHVICFEANYNLEQGFGRIYPSSFKASSGRSADNSDRLDDAARALVKEWKIQRRREGLTEAAGPDTGIPVGIMEWPAEVDEQLNRGRTGEKRPSVEIEDDFEHKRARFGRRNTEPWTTSSQVVDEPLHVVPLLARTRSTATNPRSSWRRDDGMPELSNLPTKLSDALKRLDGLPRRFSPV